MHLSYPLLIVMTVVFVDVGTPLKARTLSLHEFVSHHERLSLRHRVRRGELFDPTSASLAFESHGRKFQVSLGPPKTLFAREMRVTVGSRHHDLDTSKFYEGTISLNL